MRARESKWGSLQWSVLTAKVGKRKKCDPGIGNWRLTAKSDLRPGNKIALERSPSVGLLSASSAELGAATKAMYLFSDAIL